MDRIDQIIDALNEAVPEVPFGRDAMETDTPEDWGAVELTGGEEFVADGKVIDTVYQVNIWMCVSSREAELCPRVSAVLQEIAGEIWGRWSFAERAYLYDVDKAMWHWKMEIPGPLEMEDGTGEGEAEGDGQNDNDGD